MNLHTERREGERRGGVLFSLFLSSLLSFSFSLPSLVVSLLSATMSMITRPVGSLYVHTALTRLSVRVPVLWLIPCLANMFVSCKKQLSWHNCASLVPLGMKCVCVWLCLVCEHVLVCDSMCCLRCVVGCRRCVGCCVVMAVQKDQSEICNSKKKSRERIYLHCGLNLLKKKLKPHRPLSAKLSIMPSAVLSHSPFGGLT